MLIMQKPVDINTVNLFGLLNYSGLNESRFVSKFFISQFVNLYSLFNSQNKQVYSPEIIHMGQY